MNTHPPRDDTLFGPTDAHRERGGAALEVLSGIWADVLGRDSIGHHERFVDLGGHSLKAIQISHAALAIAS